MSTLDENKDFLMKLFEHVAPCHVALFLRLVRLYPTNIVDHSMKREEAILAIVNETAQSQYSANVWPMIMSINRVPELIDQFLINKENDQLLVAIEKLQGRFELQPSRFRVHQLRPSTRTCFVCQSPLGEPKFDEICDIIGRNNVYPCVSYKSECCDFIYKYGHARNRRTRVRMVVSDAIHRQEYICLFDHVIYERSMLVGFSNLICEASSNFRSYTSATNSDIDQNRNRNQEAPLNNRLYSKPFATVGDCLYAHSPIGLLVFFCDDR
jgi:hypothetical protein